MQKEKLLAQIRAINNNIDNNKCKDVFAAKAKVKQLLQKLVQVEKQNSRSEFLAR